MRKGFRNGLIAISLTAAVLTGAALLLSKDTTSSKRQAAFGLHNPVVRTVDAGQQDVVKYDSKKPRFAYTYSKEDLRADTRTAFRQIIEKGPSDLARIIHKKPKPGYVPESKLLGKGDLSDIFGEIKHNEMSPKCDKLGTYKVKGSNDYDYLFTACDNDGPKEYSNDWLRVVKIDKDKGRGQKMVHAMDKYADGTCDKMRRLPKWDLMEEGYRTQEIQAFTPEQKLDVCNKHVLGEAIFEYHMH